MVKAIASALNDFAHLFFPHNCVGCGSDVLENDALLCIKCFSQLPVTGFMQQAANPVEKIFYGRVPVQHAGSAFYFTKDSVVQNMMIELKYKGNKMAGNYLGRLLGALLAESERFASVDAIVPLPLNAKKEKKRGYNQAMLIAEGIQAEWHKPVIHKAVGRKQFTTTQTQKGRVDRWQNMQDVFEVKNAALLKGKHILLVDDVVTTGASLEACALPILKVPGTTVSIATVAYTIL
ncbi:MAG TPA: phosphoribosyltransferase family protein [Chitinophagaceae bacterium]|nr:phosphoribosyltransferase family protein [Chitinophagaceae bacterium]